jgi:hypothetical protein
MLLQIIPKVHRKVKRTIIFLCAALFMTILFIGHTSLKEDKPERSDSSQNLGLEHLPNLTDDMPGKEGFIGVDLDHVNNNPQDQILANKGTIEEANPHDINRTVIILILSNHKNFHRRTRQRTGWLQLLPSYISYRYVLGNSDTVSWDSENQRVEFEDEMKLHNDMVIMTEVSEGYRKISNKVFSAIEWALKDSVYDYIAKSDDDIQIKIPLLLEIFKTRPNPDLFAYWGHVYDKKYPVRDSTSRWYVSKEEFEPESAFPAYCCGGFYFLTGDLANLVVQEYRSPSFSLFPFEDIQMGMLVNATGHAPQDNKNLFYCDRVLSQNREKELFFHGE